MIEDLEEMMAERIQAFRTRSKVLPKRIIVYRDGVSEVLFQHIVDRSN